jgi:hypothetical protein
VVTAEMEGERLEILLMYSRMEGLRDFGNALRDSEKNQGMLPNVDALLRRALIPVVGLVINNLFEHGYGKIKSINKDDPAEWTIKIEYADSAEDTMGRAELNDILEAYGSGLRAASVKSILGAYDYLEKRLTGNCASPYDCRHSYLICELAQLFDPSFAAEHAASIDAAWVQRLDAIIPIANYGQGDGSGAAADDEDELPSFVSQLQRDLHLYLAAVRGFTCNHADVEEFTKAVLGWWKNHSAQVGVWATGAHIVFSLTPNSAAAERIFSQMKDMLGAKQASALAYMLQAAMMLRYHRRLE